MEILERGEAKKKLEEIYKDPKHPYWSEDTYSPARKNAVEYVDKLREIKNREEAEDAERQEKERLAALVDENALTKEEAYAMRCRILSDPNSAYWSDNVANPERERQVALVNRLYDIEAGKEVSLTGYITKLQEEKGQLMKDRFGAVPGENRSLSNGGATNRSFQQPDARPISENIGWGNKEVKSGSGQRIQDA